MFVSRRSNSSAIVCCTSGRAPGCSSASAVIRSTSAGSTSTPTRGGREPHGVGQLGGGHRAQGDGSASDGVAEAGVAERPVEVVGPQRGDEANGGVRSVGQVHHHLEERSPRSPSSTVWVNSSSSWSIDDEQLGVARDELADDVVERAGGRRQLADDVGEGDVGDALERGRQLLERVTSRAPSR